MNPATFDYTRAYCEENVYRLCERIGEQQSKVDVVFISNATASVAIWQQAQATAPHLPIVWDYHVICIADGCVYDLDSSLPFGCGVDEYLAKSFPFRESVAREFHPMFRVIPAAEYLQDFGSDRSHMQRLDGSWLAPPPEWPCIGDGRHNLDSYRTMPDATAGPGTLYAHYTAVDDLRRAVTTS